MPCAPHARAPMARRKPLDPKFTPDTFTYRFDRLLERVRDGRSDPELAEACGMAVSAFTRLRRGDVDDPQFSTVLKVVRGLRCKLADLD
jgi:DNA-binding Xre family transcriptional regulator